MFARMFIQGHPALLSVESVPLGDNPKQFTKDDVNLAVKRMKRGHDGLSIEHNLPKERMRTVVVPILINKTRDLSSSSNYHPVSLGTINYWQSFGSSTIPILKII